MNKKPKKQFVMLGERYSNGKIAKNEYYALSEFLDKVEQEMSELDVIEVSLWDKLTFNYRYKLYKELEDYKKAFSKCKPYILKTITSMIFLDNFGKKRKKGN